MRRNVRVMIDEHGVEIVVLVMMRLGNDEEYEAEQ